MNRLLNFLIPGILCIVIATACSEDSDNSASNGRLSIQLTDAPFPSDLVTEANVTIEKIEIRRQDDSDESSYVILSEEESSFNLLDLTNGVTASLVDLDIEIGSYDQIRLYVADASVKLTDSTIFDLKVPSGAQSGIKIFIDPSIEVAGGLTTELLLDFDVSRSFVVQGNPNTPAGINGFIFKPTIKASNLTTSGRLQGNVTDSLSTGINGALVSVYAADTLNTSALTNESGEYTVLGLNAGTYDLIVEYGEYQAVTVEDVAIVAGNVTTQNAQLIE